MTEIYSLPASASLLTEVNKVGAPGRRKDQDGTIGDRTHMGHVSDHNLDEIGNTGTSSDADDIPEVHARDIDARGPWLADWSMERIVQIIVARCRSGAEKRLKYIIFSGRIWAASSGWQQKIYTGPDQHYDHGHFSFRYGSGSGQSNPENITAPWGLLAALEAEESFMATLTDAEKTALLKQQRHTWMMTRNIESLLTALAQGNASRPKWADATTGYTYGAVPMFANVTLGRLVAEGVTDADLKQALEALPTADENARAVLEALEADTPAQVADALRTVLGDRAAEVGKLLAGLQ